MGTRGRRAGVRWMGVALACVMVGCALIRGPAPESPEAARLRSEGEARLRASVEALLAAEPSLPAGSIRVEVVRADVHLHGTVGGYGALRCALGTAARAPGARLVVDFLEVLPGPRTVPCRGASGVDDAPAAAAVAAGARRPLPSEGFRPSSVSFDGTGRWTNGTQR